MQVSQTILRIALSAAIVAFTPVCSGAIEPVESVDELSPDIQAALAHSRELADAAIADFEAEIQMAIASYPDAPTPAQQAIDSLGRLQSEIRRGARRHEAGFMKGAPEAITLCVPTIFSLCLNGRFQVFGIWDSPYDGVGAFPVFARQLTPQSGVMFFQDPTNFEVVIKVLNSNCFASPARPWVFAAGLTNFGVTYTVRDLLSGSERTYNNPLGTSFQPLQDQSTSFACF